MTAFTPVWKVTINSIDYTDVTLANLTITSGRTDIYRQPVAKSIMRVCTDQV